MQPRYWWRSSQKRAHSRGGSIQILPGQYLHGRRWAFAFGLVHGFGFAAVLHDLGLPQGTLALVGFNLGVEAGQLAIVGVFLPVAFLLRRTTFYRRGILVGGSAAIVFLAGLWLIERAFDVKLLAA